MHSEHLGRKPLAPGSSDPQCSFLWSKPTPPDGLMLWHGNLRPGAEDVLLGIEFPKLARFFRCQCHDWMLGLYIALLQLLGFEHGNCPWPGGSRNRQALRFPFLVLRILVRVLHSALPKYFPTGPVSASMSTPNRRSRINYLMSLRAPLVPCETLSPPYKVPMTRCRTWQHCGYSQSP